VSANRSWEFKQAKCESDESGIFCLDKLECDELYRVRTLGCAVTSPGRAFKIADRSVTACDLRSVPTPEHWIQRNNVIAAYGAEVYS
jgi:hypothetical protein